MKAAVVTFVRAYNYGAVLQCYALCKTLKKLGIDTETIDYYPEYFKNLYNLNYIGEPRYFPYRPIKSWLKFTPMWMKLNRRNRGFEKFITKYIPITSKQYTSFESLNAENFNYDVYISGSDQVWSDKCANFDPTFFLQFSAALHSKRTSYAASFGFASIPDSSKEEYIKRLNGWNSYSVREESGQKILKDLLNINSTVCCDPTLLLTHAEWNATRAKKKIKKPYILVYSVNASKELYKYAKQLSNEKGMKVIYVPCVLHHNHIMGTFVNEYGFRTLSHVSPDEWLDLFANASYVLTDSFHGTVFSIIFRRQFMTVINHAGGKNHRASELLKSLCIPERELSNGFINTIDISINWKDIEENLSLLRSTACSYLENLKTEE